MKNLGPNSQAERAHYGGEATVGDPDPDKFRKPNSLEIIDELQHFTLFWQRMRAHPQLVGWRSTKDFEEDMINLKSAVYIAKSLVSSTKL